MSTIERVLLATMAIFGAIAVFCFAMAAITSTGCQ